jgi:hypothetical protein
LYFLTEDEKSFFEALCETIVPAGSNSTLDPGALTVGGISYIDSHLHELPKETQRYFRKAIDLVNTACEKKFSSRRFANLKLSEQDEILRDLYLNPLSREMIFDLRSLVLEAFYSDYHDPSYKGMTAWEYVEFGGKRISNLKKDWTFLQVWKDHKVEETKPRE